MSFQPLYGQQPETRSRVRITVEAPIPISAKTAESWQAPEHTSQWQRAGNINFAPRARIQKDVNVGCRVRRR